MGWYEEEKIRNQIASDNNEIKQKLDNINQAQQTPFIGSNNTPSFWEIIKEHPKIALCVFGTLFISSIVAPIIMFGIPFILKLLNIL